VVAGGSGLRTAVPAGSLIPAVPEQLKRDEADDPRFQLSSSWAGTWLSRETASSASPRRSRRTNSVFRCRLQRSGSSSPSEGGGGSLPGVVVGFRVLSFMPGLLGCRHSRPDGVQENRFRFEHDYREPDQPRGHLGGGRLAGSLAERHNAYQHPLPRLGLPRDHSADCPLGRDAGLQGTMTVGAELSARSGSRPNREGG